MRLMITKGRLAALKRPVYIQGLPGVGNVGRIAIDILVEQLKAKPIAVFNVEERPSLVLVQPDNTVRAPSLTLYAARQKGRDFLLLSGDGQPDSEGGTYELAQALVALLSEAGCQEIITLGGIGLQQAPEKPRIYIIGNDKALVTRMKACGADPKVHGVVGPIIGLTGVLLIASKGRIPAAALLAESLAHPLFLGLRGAEQLLAFLAEAYSLKLDTAGLAASIAAIESAMHGQAPAGELPKDETNYIG